MIITFYYWCLFVVVLVFVIMPVLIYLVQLNEDGVKAGKASYLSFLTLFLSGLIPIVGAMVINPSTIGIIWKFVLSFVCLVNFITFIRYVRYDKHFFFSFVLTAGLAVIPFICYGDIVPSSDSKIAGYFEEHFPVVIFSLWIPLFLFAILMGYILVPRERGQITYRSGSVNLGKNEASARSVENLIKNIETQNITLKAQIKNLNDAISLLQMQALVTKFPHSDGKSDTRFVALLSQLKDDMTILKSHAKYHVNEITSDQETLFRELSHFLATPLATIEASSKAMQDIPLKGKEQAKLAEYFERILVSVKMCNGIIGTYKEIFTGGNIEDSQNLSDMIKSAFILYRKKDNKELRINVKVRNQYSDLPNYYVLSILLPLLSNAVAAAKSNTLIEVTENDGVFSVSNTIKEDVDVANFEIDGYSSKPNHRGMGLYTVRHLLARRKLGGLNYYKKDNRIIFEVTIINQNNENPTNRDISC